MKHLESQNDVPANKWVLTQEVYIQARRYADRVEGR